MYNHIHCHTEYSPLDGLSTCTEVMARAAELGSAAVAITDHGACPGHPDFQRAADKADIKPLFGMEGYFTNDRHQKVRDSRHLVLIAENDAGLRDLWAASTEAYVSGHYHRPRLDWDLLERYGSHLIMTTACLGGIVADFFKTGDYRRALGTLKRLQSIFGDRLYLELGANEQPEQITLNKLLAEAGTVLGISLVATSDGHYPSAAQHDDHRLWMSCATSQANDDYWKIVHMQTEDEVRELLSYLDPVVVDHAIRSTAEIAERCTARVTGETDPPVFGGSYREDSRRLIDLCIEAIETGRVPMRAAPRRTYLDQLEYEWNLVASKRLSGCYLIVEDFSSWARSEHILMGPGRGSAAGSVMSYLTGITAIDPLGAGLMFERFLTPGRTALPDFDLDLPSSARPKVWDHLVGQYGENRILRVGTHVRYRAKGILNKLFSVLERELPVDSPADERTIAAIIDEAESHTAGLGLSWPELMDQAGGQLDPLIRKYLSVFGWAEKLVGRIHAHGKHPGGVVISTTSSFEGTVPLWNRPDDPTLVSQWDFRDVEALGKLKLDFLTLRNLDTIQLATSLIETRNGTRLDYHRWEDEYTDPQVWEEIATGHTLGMFQVETTLGQQACREMQPGSLGELADLTTYVRPGPRNSGMAAAYIQRRAGKQEVTYPHPLLEPHLQRSYGVMLYQEDILTAVRVLAGYDGAEADAVRKVLGKKLIEKIDEAGRQFIDRCIERGLDKDEVTALWEIMAEFGRYAFNRAHGYAYATLAYWCVGGQTRIYDWDRQEYISIAKAYREGISTTACYDPETGQTVPGKVLNVIRTTGAKNKNLKSGWKMRTSSAKTLVCSERHLILTPNGYKRLEELNPGDLVAAERRHSASGREDVRRAIADGVRRSWAMSTEESRREQVAHLSEPAARSNRLVSWRERFNQKTPEQKYERVRGFIEGAARASERLGVAPCGAVTHSPDEGVICGWLMQNGIEHEHQVPLLSGKIADFKIKGVFVEALSLSWKRPAEYWEQKYGDEPYLLTDVNTYEDDLHWVLEEGPMRAGADITWEMIKSIEPVGDMVMYDIMMESAPHNFLANGIVVHNTAWLKTHYPVEMFTALLSTVDMERIPEFITDARRLGVAVLPPEINSAASGFEPEGLAVRYGMGALWGVGPAAVNAIIRGQPYTSYDQVLAAPGVNKGIVLTLARAGALDALVPSRRSLIEYLAADKAGDLTRCVNKDETVSNHGLPCHYDWDNEPPPPPRISPKTGKHLKVIMKPPPKICTRACRHYTPPPTTGIAGAANGEAPRDYTPAELWRLEQDIFGCWLDDAMFARLDELNAGFRQASVNRALRFPRLKPGVYDVPGVHNGMRPALTRRGSTMWWLDLATEVSNLDIAVFSPRNDNDPDLPYAVRRIPAGTLIIAEIAKGRYWNGVEWRDSLRLESVRRLT